MSNSMMSSNSGGGSIPVSNINYGLGGSSTLAQMSYGAPVQGVDKEALEQQMTAERRLRNREHAKRSRVRKKFMLESLQEQVRGLQEENSNLRLLVQKHIPDNALKIIDDCCSSSTLFGIPDLGAVDGSEGEKKSDTTALIKTDFSLIESLTSGQQNFVLSDPRLPDNPIVFATPGFYELTGYTREQVLGRNCRFLQGPGTDPKAVDVIRTAIANGNDATVCLLNYKADGTPFWNQFFVAALRDADNCIVNYVS
jgi:PAS domain S-box-containing protein